MLRIRGIAALRAKRAQIIEIARRHGVIDLQIFGSFARGDLREESDVDILVTVGPKCSPWFPGGLVADLEELLGRPVQVVTREGLKPQFRDRVLAEAVAL